MQHSLWRTYVEDAADGLLARIDIASTTLIYSSCLTASLSLLHSEKKGMSCADKFGHAGGRLTRLSGHSWMTACLQCLVGPSPMRAQRLTWRCPSVEYPWPSRSPPSLAPARHLLISMPRSPRGEEVTETQTCAEGRLRTRSALKDRRTKS